MANSAPSPPHVFTAALLRPRHWLTWLAVPLLALLAYLPWQYRHWLGKKIGQLIYTHNRKRRHIVRTNLKLCFPPLYPAERAQLALSSIQAYACALLDYSVLFFRSRDWLYQRTDILGKEKLDLALTKHQNIMLLLGHSVWLEFAPLAIGQHYQAYGSYKPFKNPVLNWLIARSRMNDVEFVVAREQGMLKLIKALQPGRMLFFLPDQDHGKKHSVFAPFFNQPKATLTTPARMAKMSRASCFPIMAFFDEDTGRYKIIIGDQLERFGQQTAEADAAAMNSGFEALIKHDPEQYMWLLKLLRTTPDGNSQTYQ